MTRIILARHGNTPWNKDTIFRGSKDIPLDDQGREEAKALAEWLKDDTIQAAYTSPLSRSRDTALAVATHHSLQVKDLPGLADLCYVDWEGVSLKDIKVKYADLYRQWEAAPTLCVFPTAKPWKNCVPAPWRGWKTPCSAAPRHPGRPRSWPTILHRPPETPPARHFLINPGAPREEGGSYQGSSGRFQKGQVRQDQGQ